MSWCISGLIFVQPSQSTAGSFQNLASFAPVKYKFLFGMQTIIKTAFFKEFGNKTRWHFAVTHQFQKIFVPKPMYSCVHCHKHIHFLFYLDSAVISATRVDFLFVLSAFFPSLCAENNVFKENIYLIKILDCNLSCSHIPSIHYTISTFA